jgi:hypothetical protein
LPRVQDRFGSRAVMAANVKDGRVALLKAIWHVAKVNGFEG